MSDIAYIHGTIISWGDLIWRVSFPDLGGQAHRFFGFHSLSHGGQKRERPLAYGQNRSQAPLGVPAGKYTPPSPKIGWWAASSDADQTAPFDSFIKAVAEADPNQRGSYGNVRMNWTLQVDNPTLRAYYEWFDVYIVGETADWEEGPEGLKCETEFICTRYLKNGLALYDNSQE